MTVTAWAEERGDYRGRRHGDWHPVGLSGSSIRKVLSCQKPRTRGIQGTGLELAIVKSIVENPSGRRELESFPRLGSTLRVALPICEYDQG